MLLDIRYEDRLAGVPAQAIFFKEKKKAVGSPFRIVGHYSDPKVPENEGGVAVTDAEGNLYYVDLVLGRDRQGRYKKNRPYGYQNAGGSS